MRRDCILPNFCLSRGRVIYSVQRQASTRWDALSVKCLGKRTRKITTLCGNNNESNNIQHIPNGRFLESLFKKYLGKERRTYKENVTTTQIIVRICQLNIQCLQRKISRLAIKCSSAEWSLLNEQTVNNDKVMTMLQMPMKPQWC